MHPPSNDWPQYTAYNILRETVEVFNKEYGLTGADDGKDFTSHKGWWNNRIERMDNSTDLLGVMRDRSYNNDKRAYKGKLTTGYRCNMYTKVAVKFWHALCNSGKCTAYYDGTGSESKHHVDMPSLAENVGDTKCRQEHYHWHNRCRDTRHVGDMWLSHVNIMTKRMS